MYLKDILQSLYFFSSERSRHESGRDADVITVTRDRRDSPQSRSTSKNPSKTERTASTSKSMKKKDDSPERVTEEKSVKTSTFSKSLKNKKEDDKRSTKGREKDKADEISDTDDETFKVPKTSTFSKSMKKKVDVKKSAERKGKHGRKYDDISEDESDNSADDDDWVYSTIPERMTPDKNSIGSVLEKLFESYRASRKSRKRSRSRTRSKSRSRSVSPDGHKSKKSRKPEAPETPPQKKKPGPPTTPVTPNRFNRRWTDEELEMLAALWEEERSLYDTKHADHRRHDVREKNILRIAAELNRECKWTTNNCRCHDKYV